MFQGLSRSKSEVRWMYQVWCRTSSTHGPLHATAPRSQVLTFGLNAVSLSEAGLIGRAVFTGEQVLVDPSHLRRTNLTPEIHRLEGMRHSKRE